MQRTVEINTIQYEEMRKQPLFFVRFHVNNYYDNNGRSVNTYEWQSVDSDLGISFHADDFGQPHVGYCLCIIDNASQSIDFEGRSKNGLVNMSFHDASAFSEKDCMVVLNNCITRSNNKEDKYAFLELLWFLDKKGVNIEALSGAIRRCDSRVIPFILDIIRRISRCLSLTQQMAVKSLFDLFNSRYEIYMPSLVTEAIQACKPLINKADFNLFQLIDEVVGHDSSNTPSATEYNSNNILLLLKCWLHSENALNDYNILKPLFSMVAEPIRLEIVKRYFHDIRLGNTTLDTELLVQFKENHFDEFIRYRRVTETPAERIVLTVPLLCDSLLTLYNTKGEVFQTFDGVLDFTMTHCDKAHPEIDFKLDRFIPACDHGVVYNSNNFKGFIDYQLIRKIDRKLLTDTSLLECIRQMLDIYGRRRLYPVCRYGNGTKMDDTQYARCLKGLNLKKNPSQRIKLECYTYKNYDDKWLVKGNAVNIEVLNSFLQSNVVETSNEVCVDLNMVSIDVFRNYILSLPTFFEELGNEEFLVYSYKSEYKTYQLLLVEKYSEILRMRILPQREALIGIKFDVFGYWRLEINKLTPEQQRNNLSPEYKAAYEQYLIKEKEEVYKRTVNSLKKELKIQDYNGAYFELAYNRSTLVKVINKYYFKESYKANDDISKHEFLTSSNITGYFRPYCAPKISEANNPAIDLPFFWCRGKECFHNQLERQTISEVNDWHSYSLYHLIEIIGYPKLHATIAGYEPDHVVRNFIAVINKVMQKFRRLKCRACGHLLFTDKSSGFNRYNYYSCINPICPEAWKLVYLNFCYKCKKGLIDSRDTKQCPNGWYICPKCLACCDDAQYERQAQRYILSNRPVPDRIQKMIGHGHNDKGDYFCPDCGSRIEMRQDDHGNYYNVCSLCHKRFYINQDDSYNNNSWRT